jgi:hypothetical protein
LLPVRGQKENQQHFAIRRILGNQIQVSGEWRQFLSLAGTTSRDLDPRFGTDALTRGAGGSLAVVGEDDAKCNKRTYNCLQCTMRAALRVLIRESAECGAGRALPSSLEYGGALMNSRFVGRAPSLLWHQNHIGGVSGGQTTQTEILAHRAGDVIQSRAAPTGTTSHAVICRR